MSDPSYFKIDYYYMLHKREHHKVVLLGASGVGKSSIAMRYVRDVFFECNESTIGAAFLTMPVSYEGKLISLDIWDTAGQERYSSLAPMYYRGASAAVVVYDITSAESFNQAKRGVRGVQGTVDNCAIILVGNKLDLDSLREIPTQDAALYAEEHDLEHIEVSAKCSLGVRDIFDKVVAKLPISRTSPSLSPDLTDDIQQFKNPCGC
jgi:small GTP-binding protein